MSPQPIAILLCAGYGTRMGALTASTPKPLLPVGSKPMLDYLLDLLLELEGLGAIHVVSNARYLAAFQSWARQRSKRHRREIFVHNDGSTSNDDRLGAIGDLQFALRHADAGAGALVTAGDNIFRFSLQPLWQAFRDRGHSYVLGLEERDPQKLRRTGVLELAEDQRVGRLHEKPQEPPSHWACPSLYCLQPSALERLPSYLAASDQHDEIGRFLGYLASREPLYAHTTTGQRLHVGSPEALQHADRELTDPPNNDR
ncbi:MAG: sugar phosphate nucleotidyltransferase [Acidobacteriota bacterium]